MGDIVREILQGGPLIVLALAVLIGVVVHRLWQRFWAASAAATVLGSLLWVGGCYLLFFLTAPGELGRPAVVPILLTLATTFAGSIAAGGAVRMLAPRPAR